MTDEKIRRGSWAKRAAEAWLTGIGFVLVVAALNGIAVSTDETAIRAIALISYAVLLVWITTTSYFLLWDLFPGMAIFVKDRKASPLKIFLHLAAGAIYVVLLFNLVSLVNSLIYRFIEDALAGRLPGTS